MHQVRLLLSYCRRRPPPPFFLEFRNFHQFNHIVILSNFCLRQDACPYFAAVVTDLEELGLDTKEYNETLAVVKQSVCNQEEQGVCCADFEDQISIRSLVRRGEKCCK